MSSSRNSGEKRSWKAKLFGGRETKPCCFCRCTLYFSSATLEHVVPRSQDGNWSLDNLRLSCYDCNHERGSDDFDEFQQRKRAELKQHEQRQEEMRLVRLAELLKPIN